MTTPFQAGQLVRVIAPRCLAFGRYGCVLMSDRQQVQIRFADLPKSVGDEPNPDGFIQIFQTTELTLIAGVPVAAFYLLVTVLTLVGTQEYIRYATAHGDLDEKPADVAETIAARFFGSLGDWDGEFYLWQGSPYASKLLSFEHITVADYVALGRSTPDDDLGVER
ncbi:hypothetical protein BH23CYA1_BH23CYA1_20130 [soil metagenome]